MTSDESTAAITDGGASTLLSEGIQGVEGDTPFDGGWCTYMDMFNDAMGLPRAAPVPQTPRMLQRAGSDGSSGDVCVSAPLQLLATTAIAVEVLPFLSPVGSPRAEVVLQAGEQQQQQQHFFAPEGMASLEVSGAHTRLIAAPACMMAMPPCPQPARTRAHTCPALRPISAP